VSYYKFKIDDKSSISIRSHVDTEAKAPDGRILAHYERPINVDEASFHARKVLSPGEQIEYVGIVEVP